jgi:hypothetical protein
MWGWPLFQVIVLDDLSVQYWSSCDVQNLKRIKFCYFILQKKVNPPPSSSSYLSCINSVALVCERTIQTERPPPVGEVSANFLLVEGCHVVSATGPHGH